MKFVSAVTVASLCGVNAFAPTSSRPSGMALSMKSEGSMGKTAAGLVAGVMALGAFGTPAQALTKDESLSLSYEQVKGSGIANRCSSVSGEGTIPVNKKLKVVDFCMEPTQFMVEEEVAVKKGEPVKEFVKTKLMTRQTYTLDGISGYFEQQGGKATFVEEDGIDYAATTVQLPGGERVPFLFSLKNLVAKGNGGDIKPGFEMGGSVTVPSYRTGLFLDPKGRGTTTGYDFAGALPALNTGTDAQSPVAAENNKVFDVLKGDVEFAVSNVNTENGEFGGVFVQKQPGDTDMGGKKPKNILLKGIFYGRLD